MRFLHSLRSVEMTVGEAKASFHERGACRRRDTVHQDDRCALIP